MTKALRGFDPKATYDEAAHDYEEASRDFWQYLSFRTVDRLALRPGERVLDVPCGTGAALITAAERVGPTGHVTGVDYAEQMLAIARQKARAQGLANVDIRAGDMTALPQPDVPYDAVVCVLGIFFVDEMPGLVRALHGLMRPGGGRMAVTVFGERFTDPMRPAFLDAVAQVAPGLDVVQPWRRTADEATLRRVFADAGVGEPTIETDEDEFPLPSGDDWWRAVMGSGLRRTVAALGPERAAAVRALCDEFIEREGVTTVRTVSRYALLTRQVG